MSSAVAGPPCLAVIPLGVDRRRLFAAVAAAGVFGAAGETRAQPAREDRARAEIDAAALGVRANVADDQSQALQRAIERAAAAGAVLRLPPGFYRAGALQLPSHAIVAGVTGVTRIIMAGGPSLMSATGSDHVSISGLVFDGAGIPLPERHGLLHLMQTRALRVTDCEIVNSGGNGVTLEGVEGEVSANTISGGDAAIVSTDARGLRIANNRVRGTANGGILVGATPPATTARSSSTTASRTSPTVRRFRASRATRSTCSAPAT